MQLYLSTLSQPQGPAVRSSLLGAGTGEAQLLERGLHLRGEGTRDHHMHGRPAGLWLTRRRRGIHPPILLHALLLHALDHLGVEPASGAGVRRRGASGCSYVVTGRDPAPALRLRRGCGAIGRLGRRRQGRRQCELVGLFCHLAGEMYVACSGRWH
jgi:hypothetical protein